MHLCVGEAMIMFLFAISLVVNRVHTNEVLSGGSITCGVSVPSSQRRLHLSTSLLFLFFFFACF